jgi:hypothetical protein
MKKLAIAVALLFAAAVAAGPIHSWSVGEYISSTDLNAALTHLHNSVGHGHGPVIVNADVSASAAIAHSKMATPALLPKAWASLNATCTAGTCTLVDSSVVTSVAYVSAGVYTVNFPTRGSANYGALATAYGNYDLACSVTAKAATTATVTCANMGMDAGISVPTNGAFTFMLLDTEN